MLNRERSWSLRHGPMERAGGSHVRQPGQKIPENYAEMLTCVPVGSL